MSGYIRIDKDQVSDARLLDIADNLAHMWQVTAHGNDDLSHIENRHALRNALLGALVTLWCYADTHIRSDDSLPVTLSGLAPLVGLPQEALELFKNIWLREREDGCVVLPEYCKKNRLRGRDLRHADRDEIQDEEREKARIRQQKHRDKTKVVRNGVTSRKSRRDSNGVTPHTGTGTGTHPIPVPLPDGAGSAAGQGPPTVAGEPDQLAANSPMPSVPVAEARAQLATLRGKLKQPLPTSRRYANRPEPVDTAAALAEPEARRQARAPAAPESAPAAAPGADS
jgi:hypothetical protein